MRAILGLLLGLLPAVASAHELDPHWIELCGLGEAAYVRITDPTGCSATVRATVVDPCVASVDPSDPVGGVVEGELSIIANGVGDTDLLVEWVGDREGCTEVGSDTVHVVVREADDPFCQGRVILDMTPTALDGLNRVGTIVTASVGGTLECNRLVLVQTIQEGTSPVRVDVDPMVSGSDSPFYNYDPATMGRVPRDGLGEPGSSGPGGATATLVDSPRRATAEPVVWETCAVCCDDGSVLGCATWRFDPTLPGGVDEEGRPWNGRFRRDGTPAMMSAASEMAYLAALDAYVTRHPDSASEACVANFRAVLRDMAPPVAPPPPPPPPPAAGGGCAIARGPGAPWALLALLAMGWARRVSMNRSRPRRRVAPAVVGSERAKRAQRPLTTQRVTRVSPPASRRANSARSSRS